MICKNDRGNCHYDCCPGLLQSNKRKQSYPTQYWCVKCSIEKGYLVYLCNTPTKKRANGTYFAVLCHMKYHEQHFGVEALYQIVVPMMEMVLVEIDWWGSKNIHEN